MKICYLNHDLKANTGAGRFCLSLIKEIKNILPDTEITVLTLESSGHVLEKSLIKPGALGFFFSFLKIRRILRKSDIVHALDGWSYGFLAVAASLGLEKKIIITAIGSGAVAPLYTWRKQLLVWAYRQANNLTAISNNTKKEILKTAPDLEIKVINHGVDFIKFSSSTPPSPSATEGRSKATEDRQITNLKPYVLSVGALKKRKGYEYSIKAFAEVVGKFPELKYVIIGQGSEAEAIRLQVTNYKLQDRIIFFDAVEEDFLISLYHNAELFILLPQDINKDMEGFGLVFLEAAACGLPVISGRDTSAEDAVLDGQNGFLVPPQNFAAAGEAMARILSNKNLRENMARASLEFAQKMSWAKTAQEYASLYKKV